MRVRFRNTLNTYFLLCLSIETMGSNTGSRTRLKNTVFNVGLSNLLAFLSGLRELIVK